MSRDAEITRAPEDPIPVYIMGKRYSVPHSLTIMKALQYAGYRLLRGCGCRWGFCGACGTAYRVQGDPHLYFGLACQTVVQPGIYLAQIPFFPARRATYDVASLEPAPVALFTTYPQLLGCLGCGACTKACPQEIDVLAYMAAGMKGDISRMADLSFDCIMCGLCATRCPAEEAQYNIALLARRLHGRYLAPRSAHLEKRVEEIQRGDFDAELAELKGLTREELARRYSAREIEPEKQAADREAQRAMSGYPAELQPSIGRVEATRPHRLGETSPPLVLAERRKVLSEFHPDYVQENMRPVRVGVSGGQRMPLELAGVLEGRPHVGADFDLTAPASRTDVVVIGGGGASAALLEQETGARVTLATKLRFGDANTMMAQGGIQAADLSNDSPSIHYLDVMGGEHFTNDPDLVEALVKDAPSVVSWLDSLGMMFDKEPDGTMVERQGGGTSRMRMHSARDYTGAEIMRTLRDEVRNREDQITAVEFSPAVELVLDDNGETVDAVVMNLETGSCSYIGARAVVLAPGGGGRLHYQGFPTTNHYGATADGVVLAYRVGAPLGFLDSMQYHPTGAGFPEQIVGLLVTEKVRGLGAQPVNQLGEQFVYPLSPATSRQPPSSASARGAATASRLRRASPVCGSTHR